MAGSSFQNQLDMIRSHCTGVAAVATATIHR